MSPATLLAPSPLKQPVRIQPVRFALPWYEAQDWPVLHSLFLERDEVPESYETWLVRAQEAERRHIVDGYAVVRVTIRPEALLDWCRSHNRTIDLRARHDYAQELLARM
jgi:hypothetical protein